MLQERYINCIVIAKDKLLQIHQRLIEEHRDSRKRDI